MPSPKRAKRKIRNWPELPAPKHNLGFPARQRQHQERNIRLPTGSEIASWSLPRGPEQNPALSAQRTPAFPSFFAAPTMALSVPNANGDIEDENGEAKIIIELVKAPKG